jgi:hypothetical protein
MGYSQARPGMVVASFGMAGSRAPSANGDCGDDYPIVCSCETVACAL